MRIAAISDIHGNADALEAVLADVAVRGADIIVNLGDIVSGPLSPVQTLSRLMPLVLPTIKGNHERQLLTSPRDAMGLSDRHAYDSLDGQHLAWLASLPNSLKLYDEVLLVHGGVQSDLTYLMETVEPGCRRAATPIEVAARLNDVNASLILCGHTHVPRSVRLPDGRQVVNPGSVGLQAYADMLPYPHTIENGSPHARYAMIERKRLNWKVELLDVEYDWERAARLAERQDRPEWARALRTGSV